MESQAIRTMTSPLLLAPLSDWPSSLRVQAKTIVSVIKEWGVIALLTDDIGLKKADETHDECIYQCKSAPDCNQVQCLTK